MANTITAPLFEPLDPRKLEHDTLLAHLQGNILKGHGRDNTVHMLVRFDAGKAAEVQQWIRTFAKEKLTSFKEQLRQRELYKRNKVGNTLFAGIYLTARFYTDFHLSVQPFEAINGAPFLEGMKARAGELNDDADTWEAAYKNGAPIHAMILLAHHDLISLNMASAEVCAAIADFDPQNQHKAENPIGTFVTVEYGAAIRNANGDGLEHFGYVDGISQPLFLKDEVDDYFRDNDHGVVFDPSAPRELVLVKDPLTDAPDAFGSYFVYRKLEQNVRSFKTAEKELAETLSLDKDDRERAGAMIVGRFVDGTPLTLSGKDKMIGSGVANNFDYTETIGGVNGDSGGRCPFHAHIRKAHPRRAAGDDAERRMARRGITYGYRNVSTTVENHFVQMPTSGVGLLFMSFQADIKNQFEFIQKSWANNAHFPSGGPKPTGVDPVIGQVKPKQEGQSPQQHKQQETGLRTGFYPQKYNDAGSVMPCSFALFVKLLGGEYFFAPSIPFLEAISL